MDERVEAARRIENLTAQTEYLQAEIRALQRFGEIIGQSPALRQVLRDVEQVAVTNTTVLIQGETGTGKELFARAIHSASKRHVKPLVTVNCAARLPSCRIAVMYWPTGTAVAGVNVNEALPLALVVTSTNPR